MPIIISINSKGFFSSKSIDFLIIYDEMIKVKRILTFQELETIFLMLNIHIINCPTCRRFNRWLRSSLPGLHRAERREKPDRGTTIQGNTNGAGTHTALSSSWGSSFSACCPLLFPSSWTLVSSRTRPSTSRSGSRAASDPWECSWWLRELLGNFASAWWTSQTLHPTPLRCTEYCAGKNTLTSSWGKLFPEYSHCGELEEKKKTFVEWT